MVTNDTCPDGTFSADNGYMGHGQIGKGDYVAKIAHSRFVVYTAIHTISDCKFT